MAPRQSLDDIRLEDIDFEKVSDCADKNVLKRYIRLLEDDGGFFTELLSACKEKLREVAPKEYYLLYPAQAPQKDVDEAYRDILDWEESVKETDAALRRSKKEKTSEDPSAQVRLPIRGQDAVISRPSTFRKEAERPALANETTGGKGATYARDKSKMRDYYRAWDKVDVDAMEAELDQQEQEAESARRRHFDDVKDQQNQAKATSAVGVDNLPDNVPEAHRRHLADCEKEKGNESFYAKDYEEAEAYYSRSIHYRPEDPSTWSNRALARLKLENPRGALEDCEHALALNARYMKALHRKGKALYDLHRYDEAVRAFQLALAESPGNAQINGDLMVARRKLRSEGPSPPLPRSEPVQTGFRIEELPDDYEEPSKASSMPAGYRRVQIEEASDSEEEATPAAAAVPPAAFRKVVIQEVSDSEDEAPAATKPSPAASKALPQSKPPDVARKLVIREVSNSEDEVPKASSPATRAAPPQASYAFSPATRAAAQQSKAPDVVPAPGFRKIIIREVSDSEDEAPKAPKAPSPVTATPQKVATVCFDDMD